MNYSTNESDTISGVLNSTEEVYLEVYSPTIKTIYVIIGIISALSSGTAIVVLRRTRRIPYSAKFLSSGLMVFDFIFITSSTMRKFVLDPAYNTNMNVFSNTFIQLAYVTVGLMAFERFLMFYRPMLYMKICTKRKVRLVTFLSWTSTFISFYSVRYLVCYWKFNSVNVFTQAGLCNKIVTIYYSMLVCVVLSTSTVCYCYIFRIVKNQATTDGKNLSYKSTAVLLRSYKSTSLVLVFFAVVVSTSICYVIILVYIRQMSLGVTEIRMSFEGVSIVNCILDPFLYVLWFKESQMELLKLLSVFKCSFRDRADRMRYEVFGIVTADLSFRSCRVEPLKY